MCSSAVWAADLGFVNVHLFLVPLVDEDFGEGRVVSVYPRL